MRGREKYVGALLKLCLVTLILISSGAALAGPKEINDFSLKNTDGKYISLKNYANAKGFIVVFTCNHCPFAKLYPPRLNALNKKYKPLGVPVIAINSSDTVMFEEDAYSHMVSKARKEHFNFAYLCDDMQQVAKDFGAQKTPHAFLIWKEEGKWVVKYTGAIDDNGAHPEQVHKQYLADAVNALLAGKKIETPLTKSIGCQIQFRQKQK